MLVTEHQTAGRGRLDRAWETPRPLVADVLGAAAPRRAGGVVAVAAAAHRVRRPGGAGATGCPTSPSSGPTTSSSTTARAPGRKVCGILVERVETPDGPVAVVGIGINVDQTLDELPVALATSVSLETGEPVERTGLLGQVLGSLHGLQGLLDDVESLRRAYADVCVTLGRDRRRPPARRATYAAARRSTSTRPGPWSSAPTTARSRSPRATSCTSVPPSSRGHRVT